ncbi:Hypothetical protein R9X50_00225600 [Acrodontium crateriforme]|uniref:WD40 repeat-like protein n=1 Tax=Acrodontium crateriforme TaxID=150365 RepID=A0AAQ3RAS4_9PEZI|nr:Hypothetical protein R9X50_00225600 [Acrodontium crateriforme]
MADLPIFSSQGSHHDHDQILRDQENIPSSPPRPTGPYSSSLKPKKPPTVTPKRFTKFFTPRSSLTSRGGRQSKASRQLRDITKNGANCRPRTLLGDRLLSLDDEDDLSNRPLKRRRRSVDFPSSPPLQSSPLRRVQISNNIRVFDDEPLSPTFSDIDSLPDLLEQLQPFPEPIRRLRPAGPTRRILERSFGGYDALTRGHRGQDHCADPKAEAATYASKPTDVYSFRGHETAVPFCTASCNTNSLVAIGEEEGSIRLIDSSASSDFTQTHLSFRPHRNAVMDIAFNSDDYLMATASGDQTSRIIDMHTQQTICILSGHTSSVKQVRFQPGNDNVLTTSSRDGSVQLWDLRCSAKGSARNLRTAFARAATADGEVEPMVRYSVGTFKVGTAHRSTKLSSTRSTKAPNSDDSDVSITAIQHLSNGREHLLITSSELNATIKLWDLRTASRYHTTPLSSTILPQSHVYTRNYGINSMVLSGDGSRLYALCRDATIYAYSTSHLALGSVPELSSSNSKLRTGRDTKSGLGPLYGFRHAQLRAGSFYVKASLRPAGGGKDEMLAVGSTDKCAVLFPTDENHLRRPDVRAAAFTDDDEQELPSFTTRPSTQGAKKSMLPIYEHGTALIRGHDKEVTSLTWSHDGDLVTISDDFSARCWRQNSVTARHLRGCGEGGGQRWGHGWADVDGSWDDDDG